MWSFDHRTPSSQASVHPRMETSRGSAGSAALDPDAGDGPDFMPRAVACHDQSQIASRQKNPSFRR